jgi:hypothetical protein
MGRIRLLPSQCNLRHSPSVVVVVVVAAAALFLLYI